MIDLTTVNFDALNATKILPAENQPSKQSNMLKYAIICGILGITTILIISNKKTNTDEPNK